MLTFIKLIVPGRGSGKRTVVLFVNGPDMTSGSL